MKQLRDWNLLVVKRRGFGCCEDGSNIGSFFIGGRESVELPNLTFFRWKKKDLRK